MIATGAIKIGNTCICKNDIVNIFYATPNAKGQRTVLGRVIIINDEFLTVDNSEVFKGSQFQAWYSNIQSIEVLTEATLQEATK